MENRDVVMKDEERKIVVQLQEIEIRELELIGERTRIEKLLTDVRQRKAQLQEQLRALR